MPATNREGHELEKLTYEAIAMIPYLTRIAARYVLNEVETMATEAVEVSGIVSTASAVRNTFPQSHVPPQVRYPVVPGNRVIDYLQTHA